MKCLLRIITCIWQVWSLLCLCSCDRRPLLPSFLQKRRGAAVVRGGRKKPKVSVFDRTIILLPGAKDLEQQVDICIPRGKERETLGHNGMIGKVRLTSDMNEDEIFSEIRTVFSKVMGNDNNFPFTVLQPTGSGCKTLSLPALSASFLWTAREICGSAKTVIYIMAGAALQMHEPEEVSEYTYIHTSPEIVNNQLPIYFV